MKINSNGYPTFESPEEISEISMEQASIAWTNYHVKYSFKTTMEKLLKVSPRSTRIAGAL